MIDRTKEVLPQLQSLFPSIYDVYNEKTVLYALLTIYAEKIQSKLSIIDRLNAMIGIQSTYDVDLERRWGTMLGLYKGVNESYNNYRARLIIAYLSLIGGTAKAIKYAIASMLGVIDDGDIDKYINVYDAWKYDGSFDIVKLVEDGEITQEYGDIICLIDLAYNENAIVNTNDIMNAVNMVKASGTIPQLLFQHTTLDDILPTFTDNTHDKISVKYEENGWFLAYGDPSKQLSDSSVLGYGIFGESLFDLAYDNSDAYVDTIKQNMNDKCIAEITEIDTQLLLSHAEENVKVSQDDIMTSMLTNNDGIDHCGLLAYSAVQNTDSGVFDYGTFGESIFDLVNDNTDNFIDIIKYV